MHTKKHKKYQKLSKSILCFCVALSFFATLVPIASAANDAMPCCVGKAGHCDSGIGQKRVPPPPAEPMCGLDNITVVAEPPVSQTAETTSHAAESTSVSKPCQMECGACTASVSRTQRRERGIAQPATSLNPTIVAHFRFENQPFYFLSYEDWAQTSPRGPPADLL